MAVIYKFVSVSSFVGIVAEWHPWIFRLNHLLGLDRNLGITFLMNFCQSQIDERLNRLRNEGDDGTDFLSHFIELHLQDPQRFDNFTILQSCANNIIPGSDTVSVTLSGIIHYLYRNTHALETLRREIDAHGIDAKLSFENATSMPYLQAVIKEGVRLHPAAAFCLERIVPKGGAFLAGHFFPEGVSQFAKFDLYHCLD